MQRENNRDGPIPAWALAFGPLAVIGALVIASFAAISRFEFDWLAVDGTGEILVILTVVGFIAGILPVFVGMLWFPYFRLLGAEWIHAVLAFSAGLLTFIAFEMGEEAIEHAIEVPTELLGEVVIVLGAVLTIGFMELFSRWRREKSPAASNDGLRVAYLVAIGLGLHSVGEGLAIGSAFVLGNSSLVVLLTVGFIIHNITEGPAVISAVARDSTSPPLRHFAVLGTLAGGGVIIGGWLGSVVDSPLLAAVCFSIAFGAIAQVLWEMRGLIRSDAGSLLTRRTLPAFLVGIIVMFLLEEVIVDAWLLG